MALRVDSAARLRIREITDLGDAAVQDADVTGIPGRPSAINDVAVPNDQIKRFGGARRGS